MSAESDEDDYMSDAILNQCQDTRPGLLSARLAKVHQRDQKQKTANSKNVFKPKKVLEKEKREEGLKASLGSENKGFALLSKMGYKPGMAIGKRGEGRSEPVPIEVKEGRGGLGRETDLKRKQAQSIALRHMAEQKRQKVELRQKQGFLERMSNKMTDQRIDRELYKSQKVCEQLDSQLNISEPDMLYYWPVSRLPKKKKIQEETDDYDIDFDDGDDIPDVGRRKGQGASLYEDEEVGEEEEQEVEVYDDLTNAEKLQNLTAYLRSKHVYCVWCGTRYNDAEDLQTNCPGDTAEAHDD